MGLASIHFLMFTCIPSRPKGAACLFSCLLTPEPFTSGIFNISQRTDWDTLKISDYLQHMYMRVLTHIFGQRHVSSLRELRVCSLGFLLQRYRTISHVGTSVRHTVGSWSSCAIDLDPQHHPNTARIRWPRIRREEQQLAPGVEARIRWGDL